MIQSALADRKRMAQHARMMSVQPAVAGAASAASPLAKHVAP
jgi:hypothetical protein